MAEKNSFKSSLLGIGASVGSILGICCGGGACVAACGTVCVAPVAAFMGISSAGFSSMMGVLLPVFTAISGVAFTIAFFSLYKKDKVAACNVEPASAGSECCDTPPAKKSKFSLRDDWKKGFFWITLLVTIGFYSFTIVENNSSGSDCDDSSTECGDTCSNYINFDEKFENKNYYITI